jgi:pyridoxal phosphate enzyme (YggS family)
MNQPGQRPPESNELREALAAIHARIDAAAKRAGRHPDEITLVAVSKTKPFPCIEAALAAGQLDFGENRLEELWEKVEIARQRGLDQIRWHVIGTIQSRKTAQCIGPFVLIHAVDRVKIANRLNQDAEAAGQVLPVLFEVNVSGEESKHGFTPQQLLDAMPQLLANRSLRYEGLMTMAPLVENPEEVRPVFRGLRQLLAQLRQRFPADQYEQVTWRHLSMGMTNDFEVAIEEGATLVRIGTAIFGKRD